ncbi:MAG: hypothetical protein OEW33_03890 [Nitrospirota bacterium]|jgi:hypothetical protein|nr:hypothetical protein [Nitrospirota bacterium]MDH4359863.1 hypothetical protein [Nitrospirota bacterium]MDH5295541.1 hypothetical protein [Nitrospirota bacterium]
MKTVNLASRIGGLVKSFPVSGQPKSQLCILMIILMVMASGCSSTQPRLQKYFEPEPESSSVLQDKLSANSSNRLPMGMVLLLSESHSPSSPSVSEDSWAQFTAQAKHKIQGHIPVTVQEVLYLNEGPVGGKSDFLRELREHAKTDMVLVVAPSNREVEGPAQFDLLPEVSRINGSEIDHYSTVELGLLDLNSGKLLLQAEGNSFATLEQLDVPLASNRYPRVRGSGRTSSIYPAEGKALETLRMVAIDEALDQAVMKFTGKWREGQKSQISYASPSPGVES